MTFNARKSRSLVIKQGKITNRFKLKFQGETIQSIEENLIKCLGKWYNKTLSQYHHTASRVLTQDKGLNGNTLHREARSWDSPLSTVDKGKP